MIHECKQHGTWYGLDFCPRCPPVLKRKVATIRLTQEELRVLMDYWPGDVETMGDADHHNPTQPVQAIGQRILDKFSRAYVKSGLQRVS